MSVSLADLVGSGEPRISQARRTSTRTGEVPLADSEANRSSSKTSPKIARMEQIINALGGSAKSVRRISAGLKRASGHFGAFWGVNLSLSCKRC